MEKNKLFFGAIFSISILLINCKSTNYLSKLNVERIDVSEKNNLSEDPAIKALIMPYKIELDKVMNEEIGQAALDLQKKRPECNLGNWMADAIHRKAEKILGEPIDFAIQNYGGIRIPIIKKGAITRGKIYELMPFDNKILVLSLNKEVVEQLIQHMTNNGGWPVSYGIQIEKKSEEDIVVYIKGKRLEEGEFYKVAVPDYIANGGSRSYFLKDQKRKDLQVFIRDALIEDVIDYTQKGESIQMEIEGRYIING